MALNARQQRFVEEYLVDLNASAAARRAGYSAKTAGQIGEKLLKKAEIQEALQAAMKARSERTQIDADWMLKRLAQMAEADMADLFASDGTLRPPHEWPEAWRKGLVAGVEVFEEFDGQGKDRKLIGYTRKVKLADRLKSLELIGRHVAVGAFRERVELTGKDGGPVQQQHAHTAMSAEEFRQIAQEVAGKF